jgi:hypothetical protein
MWRGILSRIAFQLPLQAKVEFPGGLKPGVGAAQCGQRLANGTKGVFHCLRAHISTAGSNGANSVSVDEKHKEGDGVWVVKEEGILV